MQYYSTSQKYSEETTSAPHLFLTLGFVSFCSSAFLPLFFFIRTDTCNIVILYILEWRDHIDSFWPKFDNNQGL